MVTLNTSKIETLIDLCDGLGSTDSDVRSATALAMTDILLTAGVTWPDILKFSHAVKSQNSHFDLAAKADQLKADDMINDYEYDFITSLSNLSDLSAKQDKWANDIRRRLHRSNYPI